MQGVGTVTYGTDTAHSFPATLTNIATNKFRLDTQLSDGAISVRILGFIGAQQDKRYSGPIPIDTALMGIFPFEKVRQTSYPPTATSIIDHGIVTIDAAQLRRITIEYGSVGYNTISHARRTVAIDFYFDPTTHLLAKSATSAVLPDGHTVGLFFVVSYSDYRLVGKTLVPFCYRETVEGQPNRTLQLTDVQLDPTLASTYFQF
jgi:hypothetical protein